MKGLSLVLLNSTFSWGNSCWRPRPFFVKNGIDMPGKGSHNILAELSSFRAEKAWKAFLDSYSAIIMQVIRQYEGEKNHADECFLFVCEKLSDHGFRRLLRFDTQGKARFQTWLKLVVSNLCMDWHRKRFGRQRPYRAITKLSGFDQLVYHYKTECGMSRLSCFNALQLIYPDLTESQLSESLSRLHNALTSRQRWQLSLRRKETGSAILGDLHYNPSIENVLAGNDPGPESVAQLRQTRETLAQAMSRLSHQQRLLLRLRYQEGLSLKDVARLAGLGDLHQAKRRIKTALNTLGNLLDSDLSAI
jgi:RNA polymerase sigma factor (sigma-70 family)